MVQFDLLFRVEFLKEEHHYLVGVSTPALEERGRLVGWLLWRGSDEALLCSALDYFHLDVLVDVLIRLRKVRRALTLDVNRDVLLWLDFILINFLEEFIY